MSTLINIIGAGNVGKTLGYLLSRTPSVKIGGVVNRSLSSAINAISFMEQGTSFANISDLPHADITLITTQDDFISNAGTELCANKNIRRGDVIIHCSGTLSSDCLLPLKELGCFIASLHPIRSIIQPEISINEYFTTYCAIEGDAEAIVVIKPLFESIGSKLFTLNKDKKALYHAAFVFASNYVVTLAQLALDCLHEADIDKDIAKCLVDSIMHSAIINIEKTKSPKDALTGPLQRGDVDTVKKHLDAFTKHEQRELYAMLGKATLPLLVNTL